MRRLLAAALALLLGFGLAGRAEAHARLKSADPAVGATVGGAPHELRLKFSEAVAVPSAVVKVGMGDGTDAGPTQVAGDPADPSVVVVTLPKPLAPGAYKVEWTVKTDDGATAHSSYPFEVR